jgi:hypothetical protein
MLSALMSKAGRMVEAKLTTIVSRAAVVVPFVVAAGFATAGLTIALVAAYGGLIACVVLAALFGVIGLVSLAVVNAQAAAADDAEAAEPTVGETAEPLLTAGALLGLITTIGPANIPAILRLVVRNLPLLAAAALVALMIFNRSQDAGAPADASDAGAAGAEPTTA